MKKMLIVFLLFSLAACTPRTTDPFEPLDSGIDVQVLIGPMCPVMQAGQPCPDKPYQATLTVLGPGGNKILQFQTDEQGRYKAILPPGEYTLHPETPKGMPLPIAGEQNFAVEPHKFTQVVVNYDSGIR